MQVAPCERRGHPQVRRCLFPTRETAKAYGLVTRDTGYPSRWTYYIGKNGKILFIDTKVKAGTHGKDIAAKLKELGIAAAKTKK